jgi:hypothetical protein
MLSIKVAAKRHSLRSKKGRPTREVIGRQICKARLFTAAPCKIGQAKTLADVFEVLLTVMQMSGTPADGAH